jgi:hypothetical protein
MCQEGLRDFSVILYKRRTSSSRYAFRKQEWFNLARADVLRSVQHSETLIVANKITLCHNPEDNNRHFRICLSRPNNYPYLPGQGLGKIININLRFPSN